jgi:hypothetical protein
VQTAVAWNNANMAAKLRRDSMETTQHYIKTATQLYFKHNKTHIRHHSSASRDIMGLALVYCFNKKSVLFKDAVSYQERRVYGR